MKISVLQNLKLVSQHDVNTFLINIVTSISLDPGDMKMNNVVFPRISVNKKVKKTLAHSNWERQNHEQIRVQCGQCRNLVFRRYHGSPRKGMWLSLGWAGTASWGKRYLSWILKSRGKLDTVYVRSRRNSRQREEHEKRHRNEEQQSDLALAEGQIGIRRGGWRPSSFQWSTKE